MCYEHSTNKVPMVDVTPEMKQLRGGEPLGDIAPTICEEMGLRQPPEMTGSSLFAQVANNGR